MILSTASLRDAEVRKQMDEAKKLKWDQDYLRIAGIMAEHSSCARVHVGAIIVKDGRIVSTGYNGVPSKMKQCNEIFTPDRIKDPNFSVNHHAFAEKFEVHSEQNAIAYLSRNEVSGVGATMYCTVAPCSQCSKLIVAAGIKEVVYAEEYDRDNGGPSLLKQCGIEVRKIDWPDKEKFVVA